MNDDNKDQKKILTPDFGFGGFDGSDKPETQPKKEVKKKKPRKRKITKKMVIEAIPGCRGVKNRVAIKLNCSRQKICEICKEFPELEQLIQNEKKVFQEVALDCYYDLCRAMNERSLINFVNKVCREYGFVDEKVISGPNGRPIITRATTKQDLSCLTVEELREHVRIQKKLRANNAVKNDLPS